MVRRPLGRRRCVSDHRVGRPDRQPRSCTTSWPASRGPPTRSSSTSWPGWWSRASGAGCGGSGSSWTGYRSSSCCSCYGLLRGYASHTLWGPFFRPQVWFDTHVRVRRRPDRPAAAWLYRPGLHVWDYLVWACYMSHFFASFIVAGGAVEDELRQVPSLRPAVRRPDLHRVHHLRAVPGHAPVDGQPARHIPPTTVRIIDQVWKHLHLGLGAALFAGGDKFDNNVAAMPSLHGAYPMLICLFFWKGSSRASACCWRPTRSAWPSRSSTPVSTS